jgi:DNA-binding FrmR family transcriptional regulator
MAERTEIDQATTRLRRIEGQVRGIQGMLDRMAEDPEQRRLLEQRALELLHKGSTRAEAAKELGVTRQRIADLERGRGALGGDPCDSLLTQILAVRAAVEQVGLLIMELHMKRCVLSDVPVDDEKLRDMRESFKLWSRLS